jgi:hypothetical protein
MRSFGADITAFHLSVVVLGLGAAVIDMARDGTQPFYVGFIILFIGIAAVAGSVGALVLRPTWVFLVSIPLGAYGWWNIFWSILFYRANNYIPSSVSLARFGDPIGVIAVPLWFFVLSTGLAISISIGMTLGAGNRWGFDPISGRRLR